jgi:hypothetical protein
MTPAIGFLYQHVDGGLYQVTGLGKSTVDQTDQVVYKHLFPFEAATWIRPLVEWTEQRFRLISSKEYDHITASTTREKMQQRIEQHKAARKAPVKHQCEWCSDTKTVSDNLGNHYDCICTVS